MFDQIINLKYLKNNIIKFWHNIIMQNNVNLEHSQYVSKIY